MSDSISVSNMNQKHARDMQQIDSDHKIARQKKELLHRKQMADLKNQHKIDLINLKSQNKQKVIEANRKHERVLNELEQSIENTKQRTQKELNTLNKYHDKKLKDRQQNYEVEFQKIQDTNTLRIKDLNHISQTSLKKMQEKYKAEKRQLDTETRKQINTDKDIALTKIDVNRKDFLNKRMAENYKYYSALKSQQDQHQKILKGTEKKNNKILEDRIKIHNDTLTAVKEDAEQRRQSLQKNYESKYNNNFNQYEETLTQLVGKKEKLLDSLTNDLWQRYKLGMKKNEDPFYHLGSFDYKVDEYEKGYKVSVPVEEHEAKNLQLTGSMRELKLSFDRQHQEDIKEQNGSISKVNKVESYVTKIPVKDIVDPKTIKSNFQEGIMEFTIRKL